MHRNISFSFRNWPVRSDLPPSWQSGSNLLALWLKATDGPQNRAILANLICNNFAWWKIDIFNNFSDTPYGREALDVLLKTLSGAIKPIVPPPTDYAAGDFFKGILFAQWIEWMIIFVQTFKFTWKELEWYVQYIGLNNLLKFDIYSFKPCLMGLLQSREVLRIVHYIIKLLNLRREFNSKILESIAGPSGLCAEPAVPIFQRHLWRAYEASQNWWNIWHGHSR